MSQQALESLNTVLASLIPSEDDIELQPVLNVKPMRIRLVGIGGVVGLHNDPVGEIFSRRVEAQVAITVKANQENELPVAVSGITSALLTIERVVLVENGLHLIEKTGEGEIVTLGSGNNAISQQDVTFDINYEFIKFPEEAGGIISDVPLELDLNEGLVAADIILNTTFETDILNWFDVVDDPQVTQFGPSDWAYNEAQFSIEQSSSVRGGGLTASAQKAGTYLVLKANSDIPLQKNFIFKTRFESSNNDGIGMVFRWQDVDNFYYFLMSQRHGYRMLGKKVAGDFELLDPLAIDDSQGFTLDQRYKLKLTAVNDKFRVYLDDELILQGQDESLESSGRVGFMCHGNSGAKFYKMGLIGT